MSEHDFYWTIRISTRSTPGSHSLQAYNHKLINYTLVFILALSSYVTIVLSTELIKLFKCNLSLIILSLDSWRMENCILDHCHSLYHRYRDLWFAGVR